MNTTMDSKKSNKIRDIVRLQQILKKWRNIANSSSSSSKAISTSNHNMSSSSSSKSIKFLKRTLSLSDKTTSSSFEASSNAAVPKATLLFVLGRSSRDLSSQLTTWVVLLFTFC
ncbi:auxin-responsive protein SAUR72-like [Prunus yedoensis var. nudiflora]|uniref:Auxin-responsive protein SAUR72-like n=1 Tax=Prunus yedoensis var. nudiflora TaxID=2094558 RepID=A0A314YAQ0_PRUYE|nr:auxin-responsive protein SAUR72-like [Prunus yedoensis var. nudiflora]